MTARPRILLTNDDGVFAKGLRAAYEALSEIADVTVVAPSNQRSGASHTITLEVPLRAHALKNWPGYRVDFTPVDCVKLALSHLLGFRPDLVVSGINRGLNAGHLVHYSGTVGAAKEAALAGLPSMAISQANMKAGDFETSGKVCRLIAERVLKEGMPKGTVINVNVPYRPFDELAGVRWCRQSQQPLEDNYEHRSDPRGLDYYWLAGAGRLDGEGSDDDLTLLDQGYVTLTPLTVDWTRRDLLEAGGDAYMGGLQDTLGGDR